MEVYKPNSTVEQVEKDGRRCLKVKVSPQDYKAAEHACKFWEGDLTLRQWIRVLAVSAAFKIDLPVAYLKNEFIWILSFGNYFLSVQIAHKGTAVLPYSDEQWITIEHPSNCFYVFAEVIADDPIFAGKGTEVIIEGYLNKLRLQKERQKQPLEVRQLDPDKQSSYYMLPISVLGDAVTLVQRKINAFN